MRGQRNWNSFPLIVSPHLEINPNMSRYYIPVLPVLYLRMLIFG